MTRTEATKRRSLRIQQAILVVLYNRGPLTAEGIAGHLKFSRRFDVKTGYAVSGHLRELHRDGLVERANPEVDRGVVRARWRLVEERCAGLLRDDLSTEGAR